MIFYAQRCYLCMQRWAEYHGQVFEPQTLHSTMNKYDDLSINQYLWLWSNHFLQLLDKRANSRRLTSCHSKQCPELNLFRVELIVCCFSRLPSLWLNLSSPNTFATAWHQVMPSPLLDFASVTFGYKKMQQLKNPCKGLKMAVMTLIASGHSFPAPVKQ